MKNFFLTCGVVLTLLITSCKKETKAPVPPPPPPPTTPTLTVMEAQAVGNWKLIKHELRNYGYPPFYPHDTLLSILLLQTYSDTNCHLNMKSIVHPFDNTWWDATDGNLCSDIASKWREITTNGYTCINLNGNIYYPDTLTTNYMVLKYNGHMDDQSSYHYYYYYK